MIKLYLTVLSLIFSLLIFGQHQNNKELNDKLKSIYSDPTFFDGSVIVKTNILSFIASRPTISVEKVFSDNVSVELSFVQGELNHVLLTDHYSYSGLLIRGKKYFSDMTYKKFLSYAGIYMGTLKRIIQSDGWTDNTGYFGWSGRDFTGNSIRAGGTLGMTYITKGRIVFDGLLSLGYGRYVHPGKSNPETGLNGYLDGQVWLSVGYCF